MADVDAHSALPGHQRGSIGLHSGGMVRARVVPLAQLCNPAHHTPSLHAGVSTRDQLFAESQTGTVVTEAFVPGDKIGCGVEFGKDGATPRLVRGPGVVFSASPTHAQQSPSSLPRVPQVYVCHNGKVVGRVSVASHSASGQSATSGATMPVGRYFAHIGVVSGETATVSTSASPPAEFARNTPTHQGAGHEGTKPDSTPSLRAWWSS